jgi:predicted O-methyltransferase YrrM
VRKEYEFSTDWFSHNIPAWTGILLRGKRPQKVLEIGSLEGRSAVWLIEHAIEEGGAIFCVDTWRGSPEIPVDMEEAKKRFHTNIGVARAIKPDIKISVCQGPSDAVLPELLASGHRETFEFVYIDGSHEAADALTDLCLAFLLCKPGGLICVDDYLWREPLHILRKPKIAVDAFTNIFCERIDIVSVGYQVFVKKKLA